MTEPAPRRVERSEPVADASAAPECAHDDAECARRHATPLLPSQDEAAIANPGPAADAAVVAHQPSTAHVERADARFPGACADARLLALQSGPAQVAEAEAPSSVATAPPPVAHCFPAPATHRASNLAVAAPSAALPDDRARQPSAPMQPALTC